MNFSVVFILWLRQIRRFYRARLRVAASIAQPLLYLLALGYGAGPIFYKAGYGNYIQFITPGIVIMTILFTSSFTGIELIWDRRLGFLKETFVAPVSRFDILLGRTLGSATIATLQGVLVLLLAELFGFRQGSFTGFVLAIPLILLVSLVFTSLGSVLGAIAGEIQTFQIIINFIMQPLFFLSGALFPTQVLPPFLQNLTKIDILTYGVDGMRSVVTQTPQFPIVLDLVLLAWVAFGLLLIGSLLFAQIEP